MDLATISFLTLMETERQKKQWEEEQARRDKEDQYLRELQAQTDPYFLEDAWAQIFAQREANKK